MSFDIKPAEVTVTCRACAVSKEGTASSPVSVVALRAEAYTPDGDVVISLRTKFSSAERRYCVPIECFGGFIVDLRRLNTVAREQDERLLPSQPPMAAE